MRISIIIPTLNEAAYIARAVRRARRTPGVEVIVADGGSADGTARIARECGAEVVTASGGRAAQMNAGAKAATGEALVFLHADTTLPDGFDRHVRGMFTRPDVVAGAFRLKVASQHPALRLIERLANFRSRAFGLPYGDQAIFILAGTFRVAGGFPVMPIMEDFAFMRRVGRFGQVKLAHASVVTSARRWERLGVLRTTLINQAVILGYMAGVPPERLAMWYREL
ncbi:MAG: TIGR04283 family arsenosugar biosynthesis glycosyltransferase [Nitrospirae bacterium]|nr:TIGR04283 family arsenosugar biosynthesis glycosyltransferase [Nitrospirota bacterium]MBI5696425.1 TIGR04283 family arsenosugar biosynthesis glycosyltransferase [Nitrospirota bacterium]